MRNVYRLNPRSSRWRGISVFLVLVTLALGAPLPAQAQEPELSHKLTRISEPFQVADFVLEDMDGKSHSLHDYRGKVVLINFWATWCTPCVREIPSMERLYQALRDKPFIVLAVNQWENADHVFPFMGQLDVFPTFPILFDPKSEVSQAFGVKGLPTSYIIDKQGRAVFRAIGGREFNHVEIRQQVEALLKD